MVILMLKSSGRCKIRRDRPFGGPRGDSVVPIPVPTFGPTGSPLGCVALGDEARSAIVDRIIQLAGRGFGWDGDRALPLASEVRAYLCFRVFVADEGLIRAERLPRPRVDLLRTGALALAFDLGPKRLRLEFFGAGRFRYRKDHGDRLRVEGLAPDDRPDGDRRTLGELVDWLLRP